MGGGKKATVIICLELETDSRSRDLYSYGFKFINCFFFPLSPTNLFKSTVVGLYPNLYHLVVAEKLLGLCLAPILGTQICLLGKEDNTCQGAHVVDYAGYVLSNPLYSIPYFFLWKIDKYVIYQ